MMIFVVVAMGCGQPTSDETKRFDAAFWHIWFLEMDTADRKAVCWTPPDDAARQFDTHFDAGYIPAQKRAEYLFTIACQSYYQDSHADRR